jgi:hypothetical protein
MEDDPALGVTDAKPAEIAATMPARTRALSQIRILAIRTSRRVSFRGAIADSGRRYAQMRESRSDG